MLIKLRSIVALVIAPHIAVKDHTAQQDDKAKAATEIVVDETGRELTASE